MITVNEIEQFIKTEQAKALEDIKPYHVMNPRYDETYYRGYYNGYLTALANLNREITLKGGN